jgi:hypothetical protein
VFIPNREEGTANTENISEAFHLRFEVLKAWKFRLWSSLSAKP